MTILTAFSGLFYVTEEKKKKNLMRKKQEMLTTNRIYSYKILLMSMLLHQVKLTSGQEKNVKKIMHMVACK
jgi:hypothetical protein